jgi:CRP-like cAMP-binding protein
MVALGPSAMPSPERISRVTADELAVATSLLGLDVHECASVASHASREEFAEGAVVFSEGDPADALRLVESGRVELTVHVPGQGEVAIATVSRDELLGMSALVPGSVWTTSARATKPCRMLSFPAPALHALDPQIAVRMLRSALGVTLGRLRDARLMRIDIFGGA